MHRFANPARFLKFARPATGWLLAVGLLLTAAGLVGGLTLTPPDYLQGETVRIMYVHVPAAWLGMAGWAGIAGASIAQFVWRHPLAAIGGRALAPAGATFAAICLLTGSIWGRPTWGTWWEWDGRLTSMLILFFLYLGYIALWNAIEDEARAARAAAILALVGAVNLPIIKFSVDWWNTLHQGESIISGQIASIFLWPLLFMALGYMLLFASLWMVRIRTEIVNRRARSLMQRAG